MRQLLANAVGQGLILPPLKLEFLMVRLRRLDEIIPSWSPFTATVQRVYSAVHDPLTIVDQADAGRHAYKRFWDVALLGGPVLVRHGARAAVAEEKISSLQIVPGFALSAAAVAVLPLTCMAGGVFTMLNRGNVASKETAYVYRLKTAIKGHLSTPVRPPILSTEEVGGEKALRRHVQWQMDGQPARVQNSVALFHWLRIWDSTIQTSRA